MSHQETIAGLIDSIVLQLCYDGWWETLADGRMEYVNAKNIIFFFGKIVYLISFWQEYM